MRALLVRVAADKSAGGGRWNGPVNSETNEFVYVSIPEEKTMRAGLEKPYRLLEPALARFGRTLPMSLADRHMHLDPDFTHLTYGDCRERAKQIASKLQKGDLLVFYSGLQDIRGRERLVYALIGLFVIDRIESASQVRPEDWDCNAHTRRIPELVTDDIVVRANPRVSGRLERCIPIGEWRNRAYRVTKPLLDAWGGLSIKDGYLQRSARLPEFKDTERFYRWFKNQGMALVSRNN